MHTRTALLWLFVAALGGGCSKAPASGEAPPLPPASAASGSPEAPARQGTARTITGPVLETMDAASYTYVRVRADDGDVWAASRQFPVKVGDRVAVPLEMPMKNFHSQSLNRDFPLIYFASQITHEGEPSGQAGGAPMPGLMSSHGGGATAAPQVTETIAAPQGGRSIADVWANRTSLAGKSVTVRGKVVKFNGGILGHNWLHLQDGSGKPADGSNDITVTTSQDVVVNVGDTVTVTGTVAIDKDFTAGYAYPVMLENGVVRK